MQNNSQNKYLSAIRYYIYWNGIYLFKTGFYSPNQVFKFSLQLHHNSMLIVQKIIFDSKITEHYRDYGKKVRNLRGIISAETYSISSKLKDH